MLWSQTVTDLAILLQGPCPPCVIGAQGERRRIEFFVGGPSYPSESWQLPELCVRHWFVYNASPLIAQEGNTRALRPVQAIVPSLKCHICRTAWNSARRLCRLIGVALRDPSLMVVYRAGPGVCLMHLNTLVESIDDALGRTVLEAATIRLDSLGWELAERARKRAWQHRDEPSGSETDAPARALWAIAGGVAREPSAKGFATRLA